MDPSGGAAAYASLPLDARVAVGELLCALAVESHKFRHHAAASVSALQALGRARNAQWAKLPKSSDEARAVRAALGKKYETIRMALGSFRRQPVGSDRTGREYFLLGEQWGTLFVCEPEPTDGETFDASDEDGAGNDEGADEGENDGDATDDEATEDETGSGYDNGDGDGSGGGGGDDDGSGDGEKPSLPLSVDGSALTPTKASAKKPPKAKARRASARQSSVWRGISAAADLRALIASLSPTPPFGAEARLRAALQHFEPRIAAAMDQALGSPSDGLLGAICSKCFKQTEEVILCDGSGGAECNEEWCFACAGVAALPEGDWRCARCRG